MNHVTRDETSYETLKYEQQEHVVVLTYKPGESRTEAATFGKAVLRQALALS